MTRHSCNAMRVFWLLQLCMTTMIVVAFDTNNDSPTNALKGLTHNVGDTSIQVGDESIFSRELKKKRGRKGMKKKKKKGKGKKKNGKKNGKNKPAYYDSSYPRYCTSFDFLGKGYRRLPSIFEDSNNNNDGNNNGINNYSNGNNGYYGWCRANIVDVANQNSDLSIFLDLVKRAGLEDVFLCPGPFTVLAPTNEAFERNPALLEYLEDPENIDDLQEVLLYHVLPGYTPSLDFVEGPTSTLQDESIMVDLFPLTFNDEAEVVEGDINACNGIIHSIDDVMTPPGIDLLPDSCSLYDFLEENSQPNNNMRGIFNRKLQFDGALCEDNVYQTISQDPDYSIFVELVEAVGLEEIFLCPGPYTVFVPNNAAFQALDQDLLQLLLDPMNEDDLKAVLLYHILPGLELSSDLEEKSYETLQGESVDITLNPIRVNDSTVLDPDNLACNGVFHGIEDVLVPPSLQPAPAPSSALSSTPSSAPSSAPIAAPAITIPPGFELPPVSTPVIVTFAPVTLLPTTTDATARPTFNPQRTMFSTFIPVDNFWFAYNSRTREATEIPDEPTKAMLDQLTVSTAQFFKDQFNKNFQDFGVINNVDISLAVNFTEYNMGIPQENYNLYVDWDANATIETNVPFQVSGGQLSTFLTSLDIRDYILRYVRDIKPGYFASVIGAKAGITSSGGMPAYPNGTEYQD